MGQPPGYAPAAASILPDGHPFLSSLLDDIAPTAIRSNRIPRGWAEAPGQRGRPSLLLRLFRPAHEHEHDVALVRKRMRPVIPRPPVLDVENLDVGT